MGVIRTDFWLKKSGDAMAWCERLEKYFPEANAADIYEHLHAHGLDTLTYRHSKTTDSSLDQRIWYLVKAEELKLKKAWRVPDIPIFILPADRSDQQLQKEYSGKSGLSFYDKLFLFVSSDHDERDILSLFTHEFNHVARLNHNHKTEDEICLIDSVIMEGLAEYAVYEQFGKAYTAAWTGYYNDRTLEYIIETFIKPNQDLKRSHLLHDHILYGYRSYPPMAGYAAGYHIVKTYLNEANITWPELFKTPSKMIAGLI